MGRDLDHDIRTRIGRRLGMARAARGLAVYSAGRSGIGYRVIDRLERGANEAVHLHTMWMLAQHYRVALADLVSLELPVADRSAFGAWPTVAPTIVATDQHLRRALRDLRLRSDLGTPTLAQVAHVHQTWIVRVESGELAHVDLVRLTRCCYALNVPLRDLLPPEHRGESRADRLARAARPDQREGEPADE